MLFWGALVVGIVFAGIGLAMAFNVWDLADEAGPPRGLWQAIVRGNRVTRRVQGGTMAAFGIALLVAAVTEFR